jgi:diguanylate cyclase (GGDEF)-like protein
MTMPRGIRRSLENYVSLRSDFFRNGDQQIANANYFTLKRSTVVTIVILAIMEAAGGLTGQSAGFLFACLSALLWVVVITAITYGNGNNLRHRPRSVHALCLAFLLPLYMLTVYVSTAGIRDETGIFFSPFLLILTIAFVLPPWQTIVIVTASSCAFIWISMGIKAPEHFNQDIVTAAVTWALSLMATLEMLSIRLRDYHLQNELMYRSSTDGLTGLMNKTTAESACGAYLKRTGGRECLALMAIDLDQFKQINDALGHQAGDEALEMFGETLLTLFRAQDIVGRIGGDEFVVLMKRTEDRSLACRRAEAVCAAARGTRLEGFVGGLTCSIGIAMCPEHGTDYETLFHKADEALYRTKKAGKDGYRIAE